MQSGKLCSLKLDTTEISIDCGCAEGELTLEPNIKELGKWDPEQNQKVIKYAHNYFSKNKFTLREIRIFKTKEKYYLYVSIFEKIYQNRFLFYYDK